MKTKFILFSFLILISSFAQSFANPIVVIAPTCLLKNLTTPYQTLSRVENLNLISTDAKGIDALITAKAQRSKTPCGGFSDVSLAWNSLHSPNSQEFLASYLPHTTVNNLFKKYTIKYREQTQALIKNIDAHLMWNDLKKLTSFNDRSASTDNGVKAAAWIKTHIETIAKNTGHNDVQVYYIPTGSRYKQPSVVAKLGNSKEPGIVIGGHLDTLSSTYELKPGADDDGSGTVTVMGIARTILKSGKTFKRPIYFVWYAAEEPGLVGSSYVVNEFKEKQIPVDAVIQFDMTGYEDNKDPTIWLIEDNTNVALTRFLGRLARTYVKVPVKRTSCGYACSDHASWSQKGYTAAMPFESAFGRDDPYIHTSRDKMDAISLNHITAFAKLGVAFAMELAEPLT